MLLTNGFLAMSFHQERKIENNRSSNHKLVLLEQCDLNSFFVFRSLESSMARADCQSAAPVYCFVTYSDVKARMVEK